MSKLATIVDHVIAFIRTEKFKTLIAVVAAEVIYFTPPPYDAIITTLLLVFGISDLTTKDKLKT